MKIITFLVLGSFAIVYFIAYRKDWKRDREGFKKTLGYIKYLASILIIVLLVNVVQNLFFNEEKFGYDYNRTRQKQGMMPLPKDWTSNFKLLNTWKDYLGSVNSDYLKSYSSNSKQNKSVYVSKSIGVDDGELTFETDCFKKDSISISISHFYRDSTFEYTLQKENQLTDTTKQTVLDSLRSWKVR